MGREKGKGIKGTEGTGKKGKGKKARGKDKGKGQEEE